MLIERAYKLLLVSPEGELLDTVELEGYDLNKPMAASDLADTIQTNISNCEDQIKKFETSIEEKLEANLTEEERVRGL